MSSPSAPDRPVFDPASRPRWPALVLVILGLASYLSVRLLILFPDTIPGFPLFMSFMFGPMFCTLMLALWWLVLGPAPFRTRLISTAVAVVFAGVAVIAADASVDPGAKQSFTSQFFLITHGIPAAAGVVAIFSIISRRILPATPRIALAALLGVAALVPWDLIRINGTYGFFQMDWSRRWAPTAEKLAQAYFKEHPTTTLETVGIVAESAQPTDWPGFRGPRRDGIAPGTLGDWKAAKPRELWRHPVGPGWSSVCVVGDLLFTQEQRGEEELVVCYKASTGEQVWTHADEARYADGPSGPGPRHADVPQPPGLHPRGQGARQLPGRGHRQARLADRPEGLHRRGAAQLRHRGFAPDRWRQGHHQPRFQDGAADAGPRHRRRFDRVVSRRRRRRVQFAAPGETARHRADPDLQLGRPVCAQPGERGGAVVVPLAQ